MAISLSETLEISRPAEEVFAYMTDLDNDPKWQKGLLEAKHTSEGPVGVGTTGVHRAKAMGKTIEVAWQLTEYEAPKRIAWKFISGPFTGNESYTLESTPDATKVMHVAEMQPQGFLGRLMLMAGGIGGMFKKQSEKNMQNLKGILESQ